MKSLLHLNRDSIAIEFSLILKGPEYHPESLQYMYKYLLLCSLDQLP